MNSANLQLSRRHLILRYDYIPASDLIIKAYQLVVNIEANEASMDGFINDIITITIYYPCWVERAKNKASLVVHNILRPLDPYEPLK